MVFIKDKLNKCIKPILDSLKKHYIELKKDDSWV